MNRPVSLVVDDSRSARFAMRRLLESAGHRVETVDSGEQALDWLRANRASVLFLDHLMPDLDGFTVLERLREDGNLAALPVVLCTSHDDDAFRDDVLARGGQEVLVKPPGVPALFTVLERLRHAGALVELPDDGAPAADGTLPLADPAAADEPPPPHAALRDAIDSLVGRLSRTTAEQLDDLRTAVSALSTTSGQEYQRSEAQRTAVGEAFDGLRSSLAMDREAATAAVAAVEAKLERLSIRVDESLAALRDEFAQRLHTLTQEQARSQQAAHESALNEARTVSERMVMNAAKKISNEIAESILDVLRPQLGRTG